MVQVGNAPGSDVSLGYYSMTAIPFAFGIAIIAMAYGVGPVSGCHVNPAVSLACAICKRMCPKTMLVWKPPLQTPSPSLAPNNPSSKSTTTKTL